MKVSTRHELQSLFDEIQISQGTAEGSSLAYRFAWFVLLAAPLIGFWIIRQFLAPFSDISLLVLLPFFVQSLYTIIQYKVNKRLRPILEALLYVPEEKPIQAEEVLGARITSGDARPTRKRTKSEKTPRRLTTGKR